MSDIFGTFPARWQNIKIASGVSKEVTLIENSAKAQTKTTKSRHKNPPPKEWFAGNPSVEIYEVIKEV